ncbi:type II toxin-antitoxin system PrlF family antitoxin [Candidatus Daviesbacteria bacterium]|nr:type II toxin-antitoxin system PrlF family antitoxin [Candidatus Daviesbacteria bacterium]
MKEILSTITSKGQITIPAEVRRHLKVATRDKVAFVLEADGTVRLAAPRYPDIASLRGAAGSLKQPLTWQEMREIAHEDRLKAKYPSQP